MEQENPPIQITEDDIQQANRLSDHCPICGSPVQEQDDHPALIPVVCGNCNTLYHKACWEQSGGKCAILGCNHTKYFVYGTKSETILTITDSDLSQSAPNARGNRNRTKEIKDEQRRQVEELRRPDSWLRRLFQWLLDQIRIG